MIPNLYVLEIPKKDILAVSTRLPLLLVRELEKQGRGSYQSAVIHVDGYNDVTDELCEIPEVRKWVDAVFRAIPHLLFFLNREMEGHVYFLECMADIRTVKTGKLQSINEFFEENGLEAELPKLPVYMEFTPRFFSNMFVELRKFGKRINANQEVENLIAYLETTFLIGPPLF
jgi:hypothetical protein